MLEFDYYGKQGDGVVNINEGYQCTLLDGTEGTKTGDVCDGTSIYDTQTCQALDIKETDSYKAIVTYSGLDVYRPTPVSSSYPIFLGDVVRTAAPAPPDTSLTGSFTLADNPEILQPADGFREIVDIGGNAKALWGVSGWLQGVGNCRFEKRRDRGGTEQFPLHRRATAGGGSG